MTNTFLFEIGCEPIPSHLQSTALAQMETLLEQHSGHQLGFKSSQCFITAQRMAFILENPTVTTSSASIKGPPVSLGEKALSGFVRSCNIDPQQCYQKETPKGLTWFAPPPAPPPLEEVLIELCKNILDTLTWPKGLRLWGQKHWIRPVRTLVSLYNDIHLDWSWGALHTQQNICVHRLCPQSDGVHGNVHCLKKMDHAQDYQSTLLKGLVMPGLYDRLNSIWKQVAHLTSLRDALPCADKNCSVIESNAGLAQWPMVIEGSFDSAFLELPDDVIKTTLHDQQQCIAIKDKKTGHLLPHFMIVLDGPVNEKIARQGYEKGVASRLSDALFFWHQDIDTPPTEWVDTLKGRTFFAQIGSLYDKTQRIQSLIRILSQNFDHTTQDKCRQAAHLCYADLSTHMVKEFPNLQGVMGYHYTAKKGNAIDVSQAIIDRYQYYKIPFTQQKSHQPVSTMLAIADALDTLVGFFALGHAPSGSKDPLALRRTSHSLLRAALAFPFAQCILDIIPHALSLYHAQGFLTEIKEIPNLQSFLQERLIYVMKKDTAYHEACLPHISITQSPKAILEQCTKMDDLLKNHSDFIAVYHRIYAIAEKETETHTLQTHMLEKEIEKKICTLCLQKPTLKDIPEWTQGLTTFMNDVFIQEKPYYSTRMGLLQKVLSLFKPWGPIHLLPKVNKES